jgi:hypothetical protein
MEKNSQDEYRHDNIDRRGFGYMAMLDAAAAVYIID